LEPLEFPERMNAFMTTEHFTLQSGRSIVNAEITSRVNIYFTSLSSVLIAAAFIAQIPRCTSFSPCRIDRISGDRIAWRLHICTLDGAGTYDHEYIRAINRIRQFYVQAAPEVHRFLLFPPHDDEPSIQEYGGYTTSIRGNLMSAANAVSVTNSIIITVLLSTIISHKLGTTVLGILPYGFGIFLLIIFLHGLLSFSIARNELRVHSYEARFPAPSSKSPLDDSK